MSEIRDGSPEKIWRRIKVRVEHGAVVELLNVTHRVVHGPRLVPSAVGPGSVLHVHAPLPVLENLVLDPPPRLGAGAIVQHLHHHSGLWPVQLARGVDDRLAHLLLVKHGELHDDVGKVLDVLGRDGPGLGERLEPPLGLRVHAAHPAPVQRHVEVKYPVRRDERRHERADHDEEPEEGYDHEQAKLQGEERERVYVLRHPPPALLVLERGARAVKVAGAGRVNERDRAGDDPRDAHDEATPPSTIRRRARTERGHRRGRRGLGSGSPRLPAG